VTCGSRPRCGWESGGVIIPHPVTVFTRGTAQGRIIWEITHERQIPAWHGTLAPAPAPATADASPKITRRDIGCYFLRAPCKRSLRPIPVAYAALTEVDRPHDRCWCSLVVADKPRTRPAGGYSPTKTTTWTTTHAHPEPDQRPNDEPSPF